MKILLVNQPPNNRGDESAHRALVRSLLERVPNCLIKVLYVDKPETCDIMQYKVDHPQVNYVFLHSFMKYGKVGEVALRRKWREHLWNIHPATRQIKHQYDWADVVVCAPGGICMGGFQDWKHLYFLKWAKHCHKPLAYYGRSFGPFPTETELNRKFKEISYEMLHYFSFLSIRDKESEKLADEIGVQYVSTVDTAFLDCPCVEVPYEVRSILRKPYWVFVPNYLLWHYQYKDRFSVEELVDFYCLMIEEVWKQYSDYRVVMLPQTFSNGNMVDDINLFRMIADKIEDNRIIVVSDCYSSDIQQVIIKDAQFVIGARYHSIVFSINQNTPFIALSYEHKIRGLLETLGKTDCMIDFTQTMLSYSGQEQCLADIRRMLSLLKKDSEAQRKAKELAMNGLNAFVEKFKNYV